ncbi:hypothetical protein PUNSTDRAFT_64678 [Punctularia strigosozonata HHB-11173 SS5]|uniref:uncharacterized protein n=1 Tax=Punctularia strigosozonata (strain HHB-11173) TaxID=741275 RepID=UPI00044170FD|nr:uncharacterized protein PUNSTDRAFT_64678 [Punctularia strigosozonata HHB-11173 SS5]EIN10128.1 hypothetical protein PUNSTDRAFT_64678 [Punctularia strigosozonata HHB-11173 SS5]
MSALATTSRSAASRLGISTNKSRLFRGVKACSTCKRIRGYATEAAESHEVLKPSEYGQPVWQSHPHLIRPKETTPGVPAEEYERRRRELMERLPDNSVVVSVSAPVKYMSGRNYKYRQASDFWYLTGFEEPDSAVILEKTSSSRGYRMTMFSHGRDMAKEKWDGPSTSQDALRSHFAADDARPISVFASHLKGLLPLFDEVYIDLPSNRKFSGANNTKSLLKFLTPRSEVDPLSEIPVLSSSRRKPLAPEVARLRAIKSESEVRIMRKAGAISGQAHAKTMRFCRPGISEHALAAHFEYICALQGSQRPAYVPVVASGANSLVIHYTTNNHLVREDEMVLIDAGCEYNGYASDITRTFPASGVFSQPQRDLYSAVLAAQKELIPLCTEESDLSLNDLHRKSVESLRRELLQIGFDISMMSGDMNLLYPHFLSHPIGIDLHESTNFERAGRLKAGMVVTIEPGLYVPPAVQFPKYFHGLGVRIEDEVLVGKEHATVLSAEAPKEISDVEGACQGLLGFQPY